MSGRYEGDWVDGKYEGFGVETWQEGAVTVSGFINSTLGMFMPESGRVGRAMAVEFILVMMGARKYVGEFKWGIKHGLGHYHFKKIS
ncbi:hypothetical protein AHAS_Ahas15G0350200 [Arachis hypogaea]